MTDLVRGYYRRSDIERFEFIVKNIPDDAKTILDVGAWDNQFKEMLENTNYKVTAIDCAPKDTDVLMANVVNLPFKDNSFDLVTALEVLEHLDKRELACATKELVRVSKKYIVVSVPYSEIPLGTGHKQFFDDKKVKRLFRCKDARIYYFGTRLTYRSSNIRRYLCFLNRRLLYLFDIVFSKKKDEMNNWIIGIFQLN